MGVLSQLRVAAAAHPEPAAPGAAPPAETGHAVAVSALLTVAWHLVTPLGRPGRDGLDYLWIATDPRAAVRSAYNYRVLLVYVFLARRRGHLFAAAGALAMAVAYRAVVALQRARHRPRLLGLLAAQALVPLIDVADGQLTLNHPGQALAFTVILMTLTALALWWPRLPVRHG